MPASPRKVPTRPDWEGLLELAVSQAGYFATAQAAELGYSPELLIHHLKRRRLQRTRRGIYRVRHLPAQDDEQLVQMWLWSDRQGVFSHGTALALFDLSDILPARVEMTLPESWRGRRLRVPEVLRLHHAEVAEQQRQWVGHVPVTKPARTLRDCMAARVQPELVSQALQQALERGRVAAQEVSDVQTWLEQWRQP